MHENKPPGSAPTFDLTGKRVWVAGHTGMVGGALMRRLEAENCDIITATRGEVDLTRQAETEAFVAAHRPQAVFLAAAKVGGILANNELRGDFIYQNTMIAANVIHAAHISGVRKLLFLGSTCIYPRMAEQPMREEALLSGPLEPTNEPYAVAKIAGVKMCQAYRAQYGCDFISAMPTNAYGPGDNYDPGHSHVVAALIRRFHEARVAGADTVSVWGSGHAKARIHPRRRYRRCLRPPDEGLFAPRHRQHRRWRGHDHRRFRATCGPHRRLSRHDHLRHESPGRGPAQAGRHKAPVRARLARADPARNRSCQRLRGLSVAPLRSCVNGTSEWMDDEIFVISMN